MTSRRFDLKTLPVDFVECLMRFLPTENEVKVLRLYERERKPIENLSDEDRFMMQFSKIERLMQKMTIMAFIGNFAESIQMLTPVREGGREGGRAPGDTEAGMGAARGCGLPWVAALWGPGWLAGSIAALQQRGPLVKVIENLVFLTDGLRVGEGLSVLTETEEKQLHKRGFQAVISYITDSQVLFVPWAAPYCPISSPCRSLGPVSAKI